MIANAGAGTPPMPHKLLTTEKLSNAIKYCLQPTVQSAAQNISTEMRIEQGVKEAARFFHANLPQEDYSCDLLPDRPAVWLYSNKRMSADFKFSTAAAQILITSKKVKVKELTM